MAEAGYQAGLLIAPVILLPGWQELYGELIDILSTELSGKGRREGFIEIILMTYSYVHNAINTEAFPNAVKLLDREKMTGRGRGKYWYKNEERAPAEAFLREKLARRLPDMPILYCV